MEDVSTGDESNGNKTSLSSIENQVKIKHRFSHLSIPKPFNGNYLDYTENTTVHGIKYLGELRRPCAEKIFWIIIFLFCFIFLGYFMRDVIVKWKRCPVILVEDDLPTPIYNIPFPAVTICPQIKLKYEQFSYESIGQHIIEKENLNDLDAPSDEKSVDYLQKFEIAHQICHNFVTKMFENITEMPLKKNIDASFIKILHKLSPNLNETFIEAFYKTNFMSIGDDEDNENNTHLFSTVLTNEGVCFTFNVPKEILRKETVQTKYLYNDISRTALNWDSENGYNFKANSDFAFFPLLMFGAGKEFGLRIQLQSLINDINRLCQPTQIGFKIALHAPSIYPTTYEDYILVNYQSITNIAVKPKIIKTSDSLRMYTPHRRQCYFANERRLKYFTYYNKVNCKLECLSNFTLKNYNCVHFSLPMDQDTAICGAKVHADGAYADMYNYAENMESLVNLVEELKPNQQFDRVKDLHLECDCLPECNSIEYPYDVETEPIDYYKVNANLQKVFNSTEEEDKISTVINIFIKDTKVIGKSRNQLYTFSELVSNFGGLMGLFMGASLISFVELIYFCAIRQLCKSKGYCNGK